MNHNPSSAEQPEFEEWHLTALALGELSPELADATRRRIESDPELAKQLSEIQSTLTWIERDLKHSPMVTGLDEEHREKVMTQIRDSSMNALSPSVVLPPTVKRAAPKSTWRLAGGIGFLALAAAVLVMFQMSGSVDLRSGISAYFPELISSESGSKTAVPASNAAVPPSEVAMADGERAQAKDQKLNEGIANSPLESSVSGLSYSVEESKIESELLSHRDADAMYRLKDHESPSPLADDAAASKAASDAAHFGVESLEFSKQSSSEPDRLAVRSLSDAPSSPASGMPPSSAPGAAPMRAVRGLRSRDGVRSEGLTEQVLEERTMARGLSTRGGVPEPQEPSDYAIPDELKANVPSLRKRESGVGDRFDTIPETPFVPVTQQPLSTFSIDVDTASYSKLRQYVLEQHTLPVSDTIRIEEWINYFDYSYPGPVNESPFAAHLRLAPCPWNPEHKLVRVAIQAKKLNTDERPNSNLVFLVDVSGSMSDSNKLPLVKRTLNLLAHQLREQDRVAIVVYAGAAGCVLPSTSGANKENILSSINELQSGGSTNGGEGIQLAYRIAKENFIQGGVNRVLLCTDGDFNVGVTGTDQLIAMMKENAQSNIFLSVLGFGIGNYNDAMMEQVSNQGNGTYAMIDSELEAKRVMVEQLSGTLMTVAKDVKIQVEFNPQRIGSYRLIGYENRRLAAKDFDDDRKDAGEIGAGHRVTALYEVIPAGVSDMASESQTLRYAKPAESEKPKVDSSDVPVQMKDEWLYLKIRSKRPEDSESTLQDFVLRDDMLNGYESDRSDMDWATSVAEFGLLMRRSELAAGADWDRMLSRAIENAGSDPYRRECILIMQQSRRLMGR
jgi:Ca-activated chloride channel homolog